MGVLRAGVSFPFSSQPALVIFSRFLAPHPHPLLRLPRRRGIRRRSYSQSHSLGNNAQWLVIDKGNICVHFSWAILFCHPADYTPVCTSELGCLVTLIPDFEKRGVKLIALSCDAVETHKEWIEDIKKLVHYQKEDFPFPIIADEGRDLAVKLGMLDPDEKDAQGLPMTCRAVSICFHIVL